MTQWWTVQHYEENEATVRLNEGELLSYDPMTHIAGLEAELAKKTEECESLYTADEQTQTMIKKIEDENEQLRECLKKYADLENWLYHNPCPGGKFQSIKWVGEDDPMVMAQKLLEGK